MNSTDNMNILLVAPEYINIFFITSCIIVMYKSIEICHPIYAILFTNLSVALLTTFTNIVNYVYLETELFIRLSNGAGGAAFTKLPSANLCYSNNLRLKFLNVLCNKKSIFYVMTDITVTF